MTAETIFALATPPGRGALAVVRISGPAAPAIAEALTGRALPLDRRATVRRLTDPADGAPIDEALLLGFPPGASFTGEAVLECHVHGGPAVIAALLGALAAQPGTREAGPGEFARRALENGKLDLTRVEAIADLVEAETAAQHRQAMGGLLGDLARQAAQWRSELLECLALLEADIDFADELEGDAMAPAVMARLAALEAAFAAEAGRGAAARRVRDGVEIAIIGPPNVGKSTLINAIARREVALTSAQAGTTRDVLEATVDLRGYRVTFLDTAGLRDADDAIEAMGVARARTRAETADLRLFVSAPDAPADRALWRDGDIAVLNKADLAPGAEGVSARTGAGLDALLDTLSDRVRALVAARGLAFRPRHVAAFRDAADALSRARGAAPELAAEELREALRRLEALMGRIDVEEVLGDIFARFCIGK